MDKNVTKLWDREFDIVKNGLSETQVVAFVNELITERDKLAQRQKNLTTLTKLAERTVTEAEKLAQEIKSEASEQAKEEVAKIIAEAQTRAEQIFEEKGNKIITKATQQAEAIKANAEREAGLIWERERQRMEPELKEMADGVYNQLLTELDSLKRQVITMGKELETKFFQSVEPASATTVGKKQSPIDTLAPVSPEDNPDPATTYEEKVELEFQSPADLLQILEIDKYLEGLPEVKATEIIPVEDKPVITVFLRKSIPLIDALSTLPEVSEVKEGTDGELTDTSGATQAAGKSRKIQITLSRSANADKDKD